MLKYLFFSFCFPFLLLSQNFEGNWQGRMTFQGQSARIIVKIQKEGDTLTGQIDSPDQGATDIPITQISVEENRVIFAVGSINGRFRGIFQSPTTIIGQWKQGAIELPLVLEQIAQVPELPRPQVEAVLSQNPLPYLAEEVTFKNGDITLNGTLTLPKVRRGRIPAVILVSGSGTQDRDQTILRHKPFLILADVLTKAGYAVLRYDDRMLSAQNQEMNPNPDSRDFADDAYAALQYLKSRREVHRQKVGIIGHSEGGMIAPMVVTAHPNQVAFIISMAGTGVTGEEILYTQVEAALKSRKLENMIPDERAKQEQLYQILKTEPSDSLAVVQMKAVLEGYGLAVTDDKAEAVEAELAQMTSRWFRYFLLHNPALDWKNVRVPVLLLNGEKDLQVLPDVNLPVIQQALRLNRKVTVKRLPDLNHLFQLTPSTGHPDEYGKLEESISPIVLDEIVNWMKRNIQ